MDSIERAFEDNSSSFDEILDFEIIQREEEIDEDDFTSEEDSFYRPLDEY